jgi:hypothetical protein
MLDAFISHRDMNQLLQCSIDDTTLQFAILHGLSNNAFNRMDIHETCRLVGYAPVDDLTRENPWLRHLNLHEEVVPHDQEEGRKPGIREDVK